MDEDELLATLEEAFDGSKAERQAVVRAARDLAASEQFATDRDTTLTVAQIVDELEDAPDGGPADRWNWWMGALDIAYGGYADYQVRRWPKNTDSEESNP